MGWSSKIWFDSQTIVHGIPELLLASEIALRRLDGNVAEQEVDLVQFAARQVAQTRTGSSQIVRRQLVDGGAWPFRGWVTLCLNMGVKVIVISASTGLAKTTVLGEASDIMSDRNVLQRSSISTTGLGTVHVCRVTEQFFSDRESPDRHNNNRRAAMNNEHEFSHQSYRR